MNVEEQLKIFNNAGINYIMEQMIHYSGMPYDASGFKLELVLFECSFLAKEVKRIQRMDENMVQTIRDFYFISNALASIAEDKGNERLEFFVIEQLYGRIDAVYGIAINRMK